MSDQFENENNDPEEESFADLFESYSAGMSDDLQLGDKISGKIISIGKDAVFLDIGTKVDGMVERAELLDSDGNLPFAEGDDLELYVVARDDHEIRLSKAISGIGGVEMLREAFQSAIPVEGKVQATCKGGFNVEILQRRAFCPISQMDVAYVETPEDYVGQGYEFLITQFEDNGKNIVVSRRKILAQAMEKEKASFLSTLKQDDCCGGARYQTHALRGICGTDPGSGGHGTYFGIELVPDGKTRAGGPGRRQGAGEGPRHHGGRQEERQKNLSLHETGGAKIRGIRCRKNLTQETRSTAR